MTAAPAASQHFRGFLFERLGHLSVPALLVTTSLAFAAWHISPVILLRTFLVGLGFGWVYLRTGRLFPLIVGHWLTNVAGGFWMLAVR